MHKDKNKGFVLEYNVCGLYLFTPLCTHYMVFPSCCTQRFTKQPQAYLKAAEKACNKARNRFVNIIPCKSHVDAENY